MAMLCLFGVCIPYSVIWPLIILFLKQLWCFLWPIKKEKKERITSADINITDELYNSSQSFYLTKSISWSNLIRIDKIIFIRFTANWCKPCKEIQPLFDELSRKHSSDALFVDVDVDEYDDIAAEYGAISIPLFVCLRKSEVLGKLNSTNDIKLISFIEEHVTK